jgi:hypothetical protein
VVTWNRSNCFLLFRFLFLGNREETILILWLNGDASSQVSDGLIVYDSRAADCLFSQGVSKYPSVHPDFLSKGGDLSIEIGKKCGSHQFEHIPRRKNRLVAIRSRSPIVFSINETLPELGKPTFENSVLQALVIVVQTRQE